MQATLPMRKYSTATSPYIAGSRTTERSSLPHFGVKAAFPPASKNDYQCFLSTNRGYEAIASDMPPHFLSDLKPEMRILDVGAGKGAFVQDLRKMGFNATGIDPCIKNTRERLKKLLSPCFNAIGIKKGNAFLFPLRIEEADFPAESFDRIFSYFSIFSYPASTEFLRASLMSLVLWLKPGGHIRLCALDSEGLGILTCIADAIPGIKYTFGTSSPKNTSWINHHDNYLELTKQ